MKDISYSFKINDINVQKCSVSVSYVADNKKLQEVTITQLGIEPQHFVDFSNKVINEEQLMDLIVTQIKGASSKAQTIWRQQKTASNLCVKNLVGYSEKVTPILVRVEDKPVEVL